ncbi:MAG TPA: hypothetical protein VGB85_33870 [Nannocystis sp.]|jgi:hypothetical protein
MTRISAVLTILLFSTAACSGDSKSTGGANKGTAGAKDNKEAGAAVGQAAYDSVESCLKSCDGPNESATDKATCRLNCDAAFGGNKRNAQPDGPR